MPAVYQAKCAVFLRPLGLGDADSLTDNANDREIQAGMLPTGSFPYPYTRSDAMGFIEASGNALIYGSMLNFAVCLSRTGDLVGSCGIREIDSAKRTCEIGYWIGRRYWGKGYGREAVCLLLDVAFGSIGMETVRARVLSGNSRSLRLLRSLGFIEEKGGPARKAEEPSRVKYMVIHAAAHARHRVAASPTFYG